MKEAKKTIISSLWFVTEVIGILIIVQVLRYVFGNWDAWAIAFSLLGVAGLLFIAAYFSARFKDKRDGNKPSDKAITSIFS